MKSTAQTEKPNATTAEKIAPTLEINLHRLSGDEVGYEASTRILRNARGYFCEQGATAEEAMQNLADAICGNNPSSDASVTRRAFKIVHDERPKIAQKTLLFEISTRGYPLYEGERIIGYNDIKTSHQAVSGTEVESFLETYADRQEDSSVKCICNDLPLPFAAAPELLEACKRVGDRKMWRHLNGELVWAGETPGGNEIETQNPVTILQAAIAKAEAK